MPDTDPVFPDDLRQAMDAARRSTGGLSCSVVWPAHTHTFGSVGIILRPRFAQFVSEISFGDACSARDPVTGIRSSHDLGTQLLSRKTVEDTFLNAQDYNEWIVDDAETVGIFLNLQHAPLLMPRRISVDGHPVSPQLQEISIEEVVSTFAELPVFAFLRSDIVRFSAQPYGPHDM